MNGFRTGWKLTIQSWRLLRANKRLSVFVVYTALASLLPIAVMASGAFLIHRHDPELGYGVVVAGTYLLSFVTIFFAVALAVTANEVLQGRDTGLTEGVSIAKKRIPQIAGWAVVTTIIQLLKRSGRDRGSILSTFGGVAWSLVTLLAIPVIAFEGCGPLQALKRSASLFKNQWKEQLTGRIVVGLPVILVGTIPGVLVSIGGLILWGNNEVSSASTLGPIVILVGLIIIAISSIIYVALRQILGVVLYRYAVDGKLISGFSGEIIAVPEMAR